MAKNPLHRTIAETARQSDWSDYAKRKATLMVYVYQTESNRKKLSPAELDDLAKETILMDFVAVLEHKSAYKFNDYWTKQLKAAGMSKIDSSFIPRSSVTTELLKTLSRKELLSLPANVIPTIRGMNVFWNVEREIGLFTIGHAIGSQTFPNKLKPATVTKTALLFLELGFTDKNCSFIRIARSQEHRAKLKRQSVRYQMLHDAIK